MVRQRKALTDLEEVKDVTRALGGSAYNRAFEAPRVNTKPVLDT